MIVLVRHGQSLGQVWKGAYDDDTSNFLSVRGVKETIECGTLLSHLGITFDNVFCSQLTRARQTERIISEVTQMLEVVPIITGHLNERKYSNENEHLETEDEVSQRVIPFVRDFILPQSGNTLIVSHYYVMKSIFSHFFRIENEDIKNASPYRWDTDNNKLRRLKNVS